VNSGHFSPHNLDKAAELLHRFTLHPHSGEEGRNFGIGGATGHKKLHDHVGLIPAEILPPNHLLEYLNDHRINHPAVRNQ
jgi:hypothetical protein